MYRVDIQYTRCFKKMQLTAKLVLSFFAKTSHTILARSTNDRVDPTMKKGGRGMKEKLIAFVLAGLMVLSLVGCGAQKDKDNNVNAGNNWAFRGP